MTGYIGNIEGASLANVHFRQVVHTAEHCQLVVMALKAGEDIGLETHDVDQFFRIEAGSGEAILDGVLRAVEAGHAILVPAGTAHNIVNTGSEPLKLYTLYAPPHHRDGVVHPTRADAARDNEHFDGRTTDARTGPDTAGIVAGKVAGKVVAQLKRLPIALLPRLSLPFAGPATPRS